MTHPVVGDLFLKGLLQLRPFRARADQAHVALQHADQLRQFIDPQPAQPAAHPGHAGIVPAGPARPLAFRTLPHAAELRDSDGFAVEAGAHLAVEHRSAVLKADQGRRQQQQGGRENEQQHRNDHIAEPLETPAPAPGLEFEAFGLHQPAAREELWWHPLQMLLSPQQQAADAHAVASPGQQILE